MTTTKPERGYLGLGSNVGDREANLRAALDGLARRGVKVEAVSSLYETEPVGDVLDQPDFLNAVARVSTTLEPLELLDACKAVEVELGRDPAAPRHSPRPVDVDVLLLGDRKLGHERLTLPHRDLATRRFVLVPLLELDGDLRLPDGRALRQCLEALGPGQAVAPASSSQSWGRNGGTAAG